MLRDIIIFLWRAFKIALLLLLIACVSALALPLELNVQGRSQYPNLPNGCEAVSAAETLSYLGLAVTAESFASQYLTKAAIGSNTSPKEAYIGDPFGEGYYCYQQVLTDDINTYLESQQSTLRAKNHPLMTVSEIALRLHFTKKPLIVWTTVNDKMAERDDVYVWQLDGKEYHPYTNLHVVVIDGVKGFRLHLVDSVNGERWISVFKFLPTYYSMGLRSIYFTD